MTEIFRLHHILHFYFLWMSSMNVLFPFLSFPPNDSSLYFTFSFAFRNHSFWLYWHLLKGFAFIEKRLHGIYSPSWNANCSFHLKPAFIVTLIPLIYKTNICNISLNYNICVTHTWASLSYSLYGKDLLVFIEVSANWLYTFLQMVVLFLLNYIHSISHC